MGIKKRILRYQYWEYLIPFLAVISLLTSCIIVSSKKFFWNDELFSYYLLADQSLTHMFSAFSDRINVSPPLYFILGWFWDKIFGASEVSLRLFSSLGVTVACVTTWLLLRRVYDFWPASIGMLSVFCTSELILYQNAEVRMYGLFLAACSLGMLQFDVLNRRTELSRSTLLVNIIIHLIIVQSHLFGILYSGAILFAFIIRDFCCKILRPRIYLSIILSWISLLFYLPAFIQQADASNPRGWYSPPELADLFMNLLFSPAPYLILLLLTLLFISGLNLMAGEVSGEPEKSNSIENTQRAAKLSLLILAFSFLAVPIFVWCFSRTIKPVYWYRYMLPSALSWSILIAHLSSSLIAPRQNFSVPSFKPGKLLFVPRFGVPIILVILSALLLVNPVLKAKHLPKEERPGSNDATYGYGELPLVAQISHDFIKRIHYAPDQARYFFILDWQAAVDETSGRFAPGEYKNLEALKRRYPEVFQKNVVSSEEFLRKYNRFLVLDYLDYDQKCNLEAFFCPQWLETRILNNPRYKVSELGNIKISTLPDDVQDRKLLLVESQAIQ